MPIMIMSSGSVADTQALVETYGSTFPILIDDGTVFSRLDPAYTTPLTAWVSPGMEYSSDDQNWSADIIEAFVAN
jgi:hypothetical protein